MSDHELRDLRRELAARTRGPARKYEPELRQRIAAWARREIARGATIRATAEALAHAHALHPETLRTWVQDAVPAVELVPVHVVSEEPAAAAGLRVVSPTGFRVEGLTLDEVVALLRVLG